MNEFMKEVEQKASILVDALPYIRDFHDKILVIEYGCGEALDAEKEKALMKDIALLSSIGLKPIVVHDTRMGVDKFRENKRVAKLIEICGMKAIGVCGIDLQTLQITMDNGYIPVIVPNDIDTEDQYIDPRETAKEIASLLQADKLVYLMPFTGVYKNEDHTEHYGQLSPEELQEILDEDQTSADTRKLAEMCVEATRRGVYRAHVINGRMEHALLLELFSVNGIGTVVMKNKKHRYPHELARMAKEAVEKAKTE